MAIIDGYHSVAIAYRQNIFLLSPHTLKGPSLFTLYSTLAIHHGIALIKDSRHKTYIIYALIHQPYC